jgi:hypothetical protein
MSLWSKWDMQEYPLYSNRRTHIQVDMRTMNLCHKIKGLFSRRAQASKSRTHEEHKNISPMHESYFNLNKKYKNTHFSLNEEHQYRRGTCLSLSLSLSTLTLARRGALDGWSVSHFLPLPFYL